MRVVVVGCEYTGVTTLIDGIYEWGNARGIHHHLDDHFTIPDAFHLSREEQAAMLEMLPAIKERFQRFHGVSHFPRIMFAQIIHIEKMSFGKGGKRLFGELSTLSTGPTTMIFNI